MNLLKDTFEYKNIDNCPIYADVYMAKKSNSPVIIYIHGGGLIWGSRKEIPQKQVELYNSAGFTVVSIDYRLAPETKLSYIIEDIKDVIKWVKYEGPKLFGIDANKIAVVGGSAGGYLALMTGTFDEKPNAIVSLYGYGDILGDWCLKPSVFYLRRSNITLDQTRHSIGNKTVSEGKIQRFLFYLYCRQNGNWIYEISGYNTILNKEQLESLCPIKNISKEYPPTLLIHGDNDTDVPYEQSVQMNYELCNHGIDSKLITMKNAKHAFDYEMDTPEAKKSIESVITFLNKTLNGLKTCI